MVAEKGFKTAKERVTQLVAGNMIVPNRIVAHRKKESLLNALNTFNNKIYPHPIFLHMRG